MIIACHCEERSDEAISPSYEITDANTNDVGVCEGATLGSLKSLAEFDEAQ
jgi:hypothetical protein